MINLNVKKKNWVNPSSACFPFFFSVNDKGK